MHRRDADSRRDTCRRNEQRRGVAAVEVAVILPVYMALTFGAIEAANATYLKRDATMAAYVAATELEDRRGSAASAQAAAVAVMQARGITNYTIAFTDATGAVTADVDEGDQFTVTVTVPFNGNSFNITQVFAGTNVQGAATMVRSI